MTTKMLDPVCDMIVDLAEARDETYRAKVEAWLAAESRDEHLAAPARADQLPVIDAGMREWYKACRCCMHDAYPAVVEQLDAERAAMAQAPSDAGICETAEAQQPSSP